MKEEFKNPRQRLADVVPLPAPFTIYIDPCGHCNFKCRFCPTNNSDYKIGERHKVMDFSLFEKIADDLAQFKERVKVVNLYGFGEPLLNPRVTDMIAVLKERVLCREVRMFTNGALLTPDLNKRLIASGIDIIRISVEALSAEGYRSVCGVSVDYDMFLDNIRDLYMRSRGTNTKITAKIISSTLKDAQDIDKFADVYAPISDHHYVEAEEEYWAEYSVSSSGGLNTEVVTKTFGGVSSSRNRICSYPLTDLTVFANGKVGVCCVDWRMDTVLGDLCSQSLKEIWTGSAMREFRINHLLGKRRRLPSCNACLRTPPDDIDSDTDEILSKLMPEKD